MRLSFVLRTVAAGAFVSFAAAAFFFPDAFAGVHARAHAGALWMLLSIAASACAAEFVFPVSVFGWRFEIGAPLFLLLALPYFVRLLIWDVVARTVNGWVCGRLPAQAPPPVRAAPSRVSVALAAAARARR